MSRPIRAGVDIGTYHIKVMIAEAADNGASPRIIGVGTAESRGLRHGYIVSQTDAVKCIGNAFSQAKKTAGVEVKKAILGIGGAGLGTISTVGQTAISRADLEVTELDVQKSIENSTAEISEQALINKKILHTIPVQFRLDGKIILGRPVGMKGAKLEVKTLFITCLEQHVDDLISAVEEIGVEVEDIVAAPLAASVVGLTKTQKIAGVVLSNIGAETVSIVVFENGGPISLEVFPFGGTDITNDIALGLKIPLEDAEKLKLGNISQGSFSRKKLEDIIEARLSDIFELVENHLKKIGRNGLLPAGIVLTGGGSSLINIDQFAKMALALPSRVANGLLGGNSKIQVKDATWSVAYGLCLIALSGAEVENFGINFTRKTRKNVLNWIKQFLP